MHLLLRFLPLLAAFPSVAMAKAKPLGPDYPANCQAPRWSADGSQLAFEVNYHEKKKVDLFILTPGGGPPREVKPSARGASSLSAGFSTASNEPVVHEITWAPANVGRFAYSASSVDHDYDIYIDGTGAIAHSSSADGEPSWSPDGRWIAFTSARTGQGDIYVIDTWTIEDAPKRVTTMPTSSEVYVTWSPDSKLLAFVAHNKEGDSLYFINPTTTDKPHLITPWGRTQTRPSFSPDGKYVAFYSNHEEASRFDLYYAALGGESKLVAKDVVLNASGPSWTPDAASIVFVQDDDSRYDPVCLAPIAAPDQVKVLPTGTVGNGDIDVTLGTDGRFYLALVAQGIAGDTQRDYKRVFVMQIPDSF